jgi:polyphosphate kinase
MDQAQTTSPAAPAGTETPVPGGGEFLNRDLSWLEFNRRVLHEALDDRTPLLERVRFLAIFNSNLDEFFQKRVGGLRRQLAAGVMVRSPDGMGPRELLDAIRQRVLEMLKVQADCFTRVIRSRLAEQGLHLLTWDELTASERAVLRDYYRTHLFPVLTPLAVDPGHPFPFISNLSTSLGVILKLPGNENVEVPAEPEAPAAAVAEIGSTEDAVPALDGVHLQFARVKVPPMLPQWVHLPESDSGGGGASAGGGMSGGISGGAGQRFVSLREIIQHNLQDLFMGMEIQEIEPFRVTRNADVERDEEDAEDLLELIEQELRDRRFAQVIRLEVSGAPCLPLHRYLVRQLELDEDSVYQMPGELDYTTLNAIADLHQPALQDEPWTPIVPPALADEDANLFDLIRAGDILVHHPYESFKASVERFISEAASDPKVIAIKQTLYRTNKDSPFIPDLIRAAESGKQVACLVELKARFDEEQNIRVAQQLEKAGVHVVYGVMGLKTHTKTALVVRQEADGVRTYVHIGTGNYNSKTAQLYTDLGLFTCHPEITAEIVELFHYLTGRSQVHDCKHLLIAPVNMRRRFVEMIDREIAHAAAWTGRGADPADPHRPHIIAKMNSLEDQGICRKLYDASRAGVRIELIVRGFCCIRPGVPGLSENIAVMSVIGRFLEHSRIFYFHNAGKAEYYIGSADWMYRNLYYRVECIVPILDPALHARLRQILDVMRADRRQGWDMQPDGSYQQRRPDPADPASALGTHRTLMELTRKLAQPATDPGAA